MEKIDEKSIEFDEYGRMRLDGQLIRVKPQNKLNPDITLAFPSDGGCSPGNCSTDV